jgi:AcrR family transcriptional regulator
MSNRRPTAAARWRRRKDARPGEILAAALACFTERGFAATRLEDVAARAGVTKGTLYLYFANKEELFKAVVRQTIVANIVRAEEFIAESAEPAPVLLERVLQRWSETITTPAGAIPKLVIAEAGNFPDLARFYLEEVTHRGQRLFRRLLRGGIKRGEFRPVDVDGTVFCIIGPIIMAMLWRHSLEQHDSSAVDVKALCRAHLQLLLRALLPVERHDALSAVTAEDRSKRRRRGGAT